MADLKIFASIIEDSAKEQINELISQKAFEDSKIRIMPDCHSGKGCVIGFTANLGDKVIPNLVGVDIGCGMLVVELGIIDMDLERLDNIIKCKVPSGRNVHEGRIVRDLNLQFLKCYRELKDTKRLERSLGTLGGGNHFIEIDEDDEGVKYLVIHTGSRNLGKQVAEYYQQLAIDLHSGKDKFLEERDNIIKTYKEQGKKEEIQDALKELYRNYQAKECDMPKDLCYLEGKFREDYLHDMKICQSYAECNRMLIAKIILSNYFSTNSIKMIDINSPDAWYTQDVCDYTFNYFETIHNYIDFEDNIVRKGSIRALKGERVIIPMNMKDGSLICEGKGNEDWNNSAPHGAGRILSRADARKELNVEDFKEDMKGIYTTTANENTIDESPRAYKPADVIRNDIKDTVDVLIAIKPIYNFKAEE